MHIIMYVGTSVLPSVRLLRTYIGQQANFEAMQKAMRDRDASEGAAVEVKPAAKRQKNN